ncbi:MAG: glycosyltransferase [Chloroflexota bacterium]|nr:MAG: glycosyltransferase [Chloroflexota bacterium]
MITRNVKVLHIVHQYPPDHLGGTELYTRHLAQKQAADGHNPTVYVPAASGEPRPAPVLEQGVRVYRQRIGSDSRPAVFLRTFWNHSAITFLEHILDQEQPELAHIQHLMGLPAGLVEVLNERGIPYVLTLHDYWTICANAQLLTNYDQTLCAGPDRFLNCARCVQARSGLPDLAVAGHGLAPLLARRNRLLARLLSGAQAIIAPSEFVRDETVRLGAPSERMVIVPHGIQLPAVMPARRRPATGQLQVVYVGGITWQKGVHVLVEAAAGLPDGVQVTIYGDLSAKAEYATALRRLARSAKVTFAGRLEHDEVWMALAAADVVVVPSLWYETSSLIAQEARAAGALVIASNLGALPERLADGQDGLLFPAGDAAVLRRLLRELHSRPERLCELQAAITPVRQIDDHVHDIATVYRSVLRISNSP